MERSLIIRVGALGDMLIALPFMEEIKRRSNHVQLETGKRGQFLLQYHNAFSRISVFEPGDYQPQSPNDPDLRMFATNIRWKAMGESGHWDFAINLWRTLETECIAEEYQEEYFWPRERRQEHFGKRIFVEAPFRKAGIPVPHEFRMGSFFFDVSTALWMPYWRRLHKDTFNVVMVVCGSTCQKIPMGLKTLARRITREYRDARIFLVGPSTSPWLPEQMDPKTLQFGFGEKNVCRLVGGTTVFQAVALAKMADYVIGPVSFLLHAAGLFGTPKSMICTDCSVEQACKYHRNDFSVQADVPCCPCHRAIYHTKYCLTEKTEYGELPACNFHYNHDRIMEGVAFAHSIRKQRWEFDRIDGSVNCYTSLPDFKTDEDSSLPPYGRHGLTVLEEAIRGRTGLNIVEIGSTRMPGTQFREGYSTPFFAHLARKGRHNFYSIDIDPKNTDMSRKMLEYYGLLGDNVHLSSEDGMYFLQHWKKGNIDVLYLDAWDYDGDDLRRRIHLRSEMMHLEALKMAEPHMRPGSLVLVDDMLCRTTYVGKGTLVVPYLAERGWECLEQGWQVLMRKPEEKEDA